MKEFQALGLDISIIDDDGVGHDLKEIEEAEDKDDVKTTIAEVENSTDDLMDSENESEEETVEEEFTIDEEEQEMDFEDIEMGDE